MQQSLKGTSKNSDFFVSARKHRTENRSVYGIHEDSSTELTPQSRKKTIFRGALNTIVLIFCLFRLLAPVYADNSELDKLFEKLKNSPDETTARENANKIWAVWFKSGDSKIDELMQQAIRKRESYNFDGVIEILDQIITQKPDYSEVWNQRATIYFFKQEYEKSLEDVAKTLELEPRHFGAMAGRGIIRLRQNKPALAVQNILKAMEIHPFLPERSIIPDLTQPL